MVSVLRFLWRCILIVYLTLSVSVACIALMAVAPYLFINKPRFLRLVCGIQGSYLHNVVFVLNVLFGIEIRVTGTLPGIEPALVISNHLTQDWVAIYSLGMRMGTLGFVRPVIKKITKYAPGWGWGMALCYWPFVSRNYERDAIDLKATFAVYKVSGVPVQVWLFPEGTRRTDKKLIESRTVAKAKGYPEWEHVMLPRHRGFILTLNSLQGVISFLHDITLSYEGWSVPVPRFPQLLFEDYSKGPHRVHIHLDRIPVDSIPADDAGRQQWLMRRFAVKEEKMKYMQEHRVFPGVPIPTKLNKKAVIVHTLGWSLATALLLWNGLSLLL